MKNITLLAAFTLLIFGLEGMILAYEGGTKVVATMTHPEKGGTEWSPIWVVPSHELSPSKTVVKFLHRIPEPTLSVERIREEKTGRSTGTKIVVDFWKGGSV